MWDLNIEAATSASARQSRPIVNLQLEMSAPSSLIPSKKPVVNSEDEKVVLQLNEQKMTHLYEQLEQVQSHLDRLR